MIALFVLAIGLLPVATMLIASRNLSAKAQYQTEAVNLCQQQMETLRSQSFSGLVAIAAATSGASTVFPIPSSPMPTTLTTQYPNITFLGQYSVNILNTSPYNSTHQLARIITTVSWEQMGSTTPLGSYTLDSDIAEGLNVDQN